MIGKFILSVGIVSSLWANTTKDNNKFLVVDSDTYNKIEKLNILNGGIKTKYVIKSKKINESDMEMYYPEIFAYDGKSCTSIQNVYIYKVKKKNFNINKEIKKLKLLNILHNSKNDYNINKKLDMKTIQAVGILCTDTLHIRNKDYNIGDNIANYYIKSIDQNMANVILGVK